MNAQVHKTGESEWTDTLYLWGQFNVHSALFKGQGHFQSWLLSLNSFILTEIAWFFLALSLSCILLTLDLSEYFG